MYIQISIYACICQYTVVYIYVYMNVSFFGKSGTGQPANGAHTTTAASKSDVFSATKM